jgi:DnaJ-class molecular chaperone
MRDGQKITFRGEGDQEPGVEPGDIVLVLKARDHPVFQRHGNDLVMKKTITLTEALCGFKVGTIGRVESVRVVVTLAILDRELRGTPSYSVELLT